MASLFGARTCANVSAQCLPRRRSRNGGGDGFTNKKSSFRGSAERGWHCSRAYAICYILAAGSRAMFHSRRGGGIRSAV
eukprot:scaffold19149_cov146-Isochrysis_galbana.AAC.5